MPRFILCVLSALVAVGTGCSRKETTPEVRWRFLGGKVLKVQTNAPGLRDILNLPEAAPLAGPLVTNLARAWWSLGTSGGDQPLAAEGDGAALATDLVHQLSVGEVVPAPGGGREFALAIQVPPDRMPVWERAWPAWINALHASRGGTKAGLPAVTRKDVWLVAVSDASLLPAESTFRRLAEYPPEPGALLQFETAVAGLPATRVTFSTTNANVRLAARVTPLQAIPTSFPPWELPTFIRQPMVQFTALRGLDAVGAGWLNPAPWTGGAWPRELFVWAQEGLALRSYLVARAEDPASVVRHWYQRLEPSFAPFSPAPLYRGRLLQETNPARVIVAGSLPVAPVLQVIENEGRPFVALGVIPMAKATNPPAAGMIARLNRPQVLLYDWEITSESIKHWNSMLQLPQLLEGRQGIVDSPAKLWLLAAAQKLGETVTEAEATGEREITIQRKAPAGLNGLELSLLAQWLDPTPPMRPIPTNNPASTARK